MTRRILYGPAEPNAFSTPLSGPAADVWREIDGVLVINLDSRPDRWQDVCDRLAPWVPSSKLHRLPATSGAALPGFGVLPWFRGRKRDRTWAARAGCALSHRAALAHARAQGWRSVLILEDDLEIEPALATTLPALAQALSRVDWGVCYLGYTDPVTPTRTQASLTPTHRLSSVTGCSTTHAYLVRASVYDALLARLPSPDQIWPWISRHRAIDRWYYRNLVRFCEVVAVSPALVNQQVGHSDITHRTAEKIHTTFVPETACSAWGFRLRRGLRWLQYRIAEPRDALRGAIKRLRGF